MRKLLYTQAGVLAITSLFCASAFSRPNVPGQNGQGGKVHYNNSGKVAVVCQTGTASSELDINNVRTTLLNTGDYWWDGNDGRYEVPKLSDPTAPKKHSVFAGAVWLGGYDGANQLRLAAQTYRQSDKGWFPGPLDNQGFTDNSRCSRYDYMAKLDRIMLDEFITRVEAGPLPFAPSSIDEAILKFPAKGNPFIDSHPLQLFDFVDSDGNGIYDATQGDYPIMNGDQAVFWILNDVGGPKDPVTAAIGLELQIQGFAFKTNNLINNMTFYKQRIINRGNTRLRDTYLGQWVDSDLGNYLDDYVGCDVNRGLGYTYNGDENDEGVAGYGQNPPAFGADFFLGPLADACDGLDNNRNGQVDEADERIIMSNFMYYNNDGTVRGNPDTEGHFYNYLTSRWKNSNPVLYGGDGYTPVQGFPTDQYKFMFPGTSDHANGYGYQLPVSNPTCGPMNYVARLKPTWNWTERSPAEGLTANEPADRRFLQSAGPFTLNPGQINDLVIGAVWCRANSGGAQGSVNMLLVCDDQAQDLFNNNFELPAGPNAPDLQISELDQALLVSIVPTTFKLGNKTVTTEEYIETDPTLCDNPAVSDCFYRFEGYLLYQLRDNSVSEGELNDPNKARLVEEGSSDVQNELKNLINTEYDANVGEFVPVIKAQGANAGIKHTVKITRDLFAQGNGNLVNFKTYYYMVIAYGANSYVGPSGTRYNQFRQGIRNVRRYAAVPHKVAPEGVGSVGGTTLNSEYGQLLPVTRVYGVGNGGNSLQITSEEEMKLLAPPYHQLRLNYLAGGSPVAVKIYDPKNVKADDFTLKLSSRLVFNKKTLSGEMFKPGDRIKATGGIINPRIPNVNPSYISKFPQVEGDAIVNRIVSQSPPANDPAGDTLVTMDIEMLNDQIGGTFWTYIDSVIYLYDDQLKTNVETKIGYSVRPMPFRKVEDNRPPGSRSPSAMTYDFAVSDYWKLTSKSNPSQPIYSTRTLGDFNEQLIPEFGLSLQLARVPNPGFRVLDPDFRKNGFQNASLKFANNQPWLAGVNLSKVPWLLSAANSNLEDIDPGGQFRLILDGAWAPYGAVEPISSSSQGGAYRVVATRQQEFDLHNVDIVMTTDKNLWTRVPVLQVEQYGTSALGGLPGQNLRLLKSAVPSVNKEGNPDNSTSNFNNLPSTGMGWFPGYAIDLDKGMRVNMMFAESRLEDQVNGNNLLWNPTNADNGGRSMVYVTNTLYDEGKAIEANFDQLLAAPAYFTSPGVFITGPDRTNAINNFGSAVSQQIFNQVTWVGNMRVVTGKAFLPQGGDARVQLRMNKQYQSYNGFNTSDGVNDNPEYEFSTNGLEAKRGDVAVAKTALDLIRVVPNPYYAYSDYEQKQVDNIVKITNLPPKCDITIYNLSGTVVRRLRKDDAATTWVDWDLKNAFRLPISSGTYIIHVDAGQVGTQVVKFFAIMRPVDTDTF